MPRLPTAQDLGQRPTPTVRGGIAPLDLKTPRMGQEAQALVQFGNSLQGLGDTMAQLAVKEKRELDEARGEDAFNEYSDGLVKFEYGDPEGQEVGFSNILTGDAVKNNLTKIYREKRDSLRKAIRDKLANEDQKIGFDKRADIADRQFDGRQYGHIATQSRLYQGVVSEGVRATERRMAALNWSQPGQIELSILRTNKEVERKARLDGLDPEREGDRQVIDTLKVIAETQIHADVIDAMILGGKDTAAAAYYNTIRDRLTPEAIITLGIKVNDSSTDGEAIRAANEIWEIAGPKGLNDATRMDIMGTWIRDKYSDNPAVMNAALDTLRSRAADHSAGQREENAALEATLLNKFHDGASLEELMQTPEYWQVQNREQLRTYFLNAGWTEYSREQSRQQYEDGALARNSYVAFLELSNPKVLSLMSENQIISLIPTLGPDNVGKLVDMRRRMDSPAKVHAATLDASLFNDVAVAAGLNPHKKNLGEHEKEQLGRLKSEVLLAIDVAQQMKQAPLLLSEKKKLMQEIVDEKVKKAAGIFSRDPSLPAAAVRPEDLSKVYVPIAEVPPQWIKGAANYLRSTGQVPVDWTDDQIKKAMKGRIERAYGISISGGTSLQGNAALDGK